MVAAFASHILLFILSWAPQHAGTVTVTPSTDIAQDDTSGFVNEVYYKPLTALTKNTAFPNFVSSALPDIGIVYGTLAHQFAQNMPLETCFFQKTTDTRTTVGTCVYLQDSSTGIYLMKRFDVKYSGAAATDKPVLTWDSTKDKIVTLLPNKKFYFLPTDQQVRTGDLPVFFIAVCTEVSGSDTNVYFVEINPIDYTIVHDRMTTGKFYTIPGEIWLVNKHSRVVSHHKKRFHIIFNPVDTSKEYSTSAQPSNSRVFVYRHIIGDNTF